MNKSKLLFCNKNIITPEERLRIIAGVSAHGHGGQAVSSIGVDENLYFISGRSDCHYAYAGFDFLFLERETASGIRKSPESRAGMDLYAYFKMVPGMAKNDLSD